MPYRDAALLVAVADVAAAVVVISTNGSDKIRRKTVENIVFRKGAGNVGRIQKLRVAATLAGWLARYLAGWLDAGWLAPWLARGGWLTN